MYNKIAAVVTIILAITLGCALGQTTEPITVSSTVTAINAQRLGLNMDAQAQYDDRALMQNYLENPGFEFGEEPHLIAVGPNPSSASFTDTNDHPFWTGEASNWWDGVTASVRTGASAGQTFVVNTFTGNCAGGDFSCNATYTCVGSCPTLAQGDLIGEMISGPTVAFTSGSWTTDANETWSAAQHFEGASSLQVDVSDGNSHTFSQLFDNSGTTVGTCSNNTALMCQTSSDCGGNACNAWPYYPNHPIAGSMSMSVYAIACGDSTCTSNAGGTPQLTMSVTRFGSSWGTASQTTNLTNDHAWHQYVFNFTGGDKATDTGEFQVSFTTGVGSVQASNKIYLDNVFFGPASGGAGTFRSEVITTLNSLKPGITRYMNSALFYNEAYYNAPDDYQIGAVSDGPCGSQTCFGAWVFGAQDLYALDHAIGAAPWLNISDTWSDADVNAFAAHLCSAFTTYNFKTIFIEQSNEDWQANETRAGGGASVQYGQLAARNLGLINSYMVANCPTFASKVKLIAGSQEANAGVTTQVSAQLPTNNHQYGIAVATYIPSELEQNTGQTLNQYDDLGLANSLDQFSNNGSTYATDAIPNSLAQLCGGKGAGGTCKQFLTVYETGSGNQCGTATPLEAYEMSAGWMAAGINAQNWILGFEAATTGPNSGTLSPMLFQNIFDFAQPEFTTANGACNSGFGTTSAIWGIVHDFDSKFGPTFPHIRPIGLAMKLADKVIMGNYYSMNTSAAPGIYGVAFKNNTTGVWTAFLSSSNNTGTAVAITFPTGTVPKVAETLTFTTNSADNNEDSNSVKLGPVPGGITTVGQTVTVTVPAYAPVALEQ